MPIKSAEAYHNIYAFGLSYFQVRRWL